MVVKLVLLTVQDPVLHVSVLIQLLQIVDVLVAKFGIWVLHLVKLPLVNLVQEVEVLTLLISSNSPLLS